VTGVLRHRAFRLLWLGQAASMLGDRIVVVALALTIVELTGSASDVGLVLAAQIVPLVGFLLLGGVWADRLPRKKLVIASDLVRASLHGLLALLLFTGSAEIWHFILIEAAFGTAEAFFRPALTGLLPQTVPEGEIQAAQAITAAARYVADVAGPALATVLVLTVGGGWAFAVDALTFLVSAALLAGVRPRERGAAVLAAAASLLGELREGWSAVRERAWVWAIVVATSIVLLTEAAPFQVLGAVLASERTGSTALYGVAWTCFGAGLVAGAPIAARLRPRRPMVAAQLATLPYTLAILAFATGAAAGVVGACWVLAGAGIACFGVWWETALAERIPPHLLSRVSAYDWMGSLAFMPLGLLLAGPLGEAIGAAEVLIGGTLVACAVKLATLAVPAVRAMRRLEPTTSLNTRRGA
jgi:MFS family permease